MSKTSPQVIHTVKDLRALTSKWRLAGKTSCLVPTMGALHNGHLSLVDLGKEHADHVVVTIFVNPTQFGPGEDFEAYPRRHDEDVSKLATRGTECVFIPDAGEMYKDGYATEIQVSGITEVLCGVTRPTHFSGVATIVAKLLNQAACDKAIFGQKDYQQLMLIKRMVTDLDINTDIIGAPIIREDDGLAMSSRNQYLSKEERDIAGQLNVIMRETIKSVKSGDNLQSALTLAKEKLAAIGFHKIDYFEPRLEGSLEMAHTSCQTSNARLFAAVHVGKTRLIDNISF